MRDVGESPSGKARDFGSRIRRFESCLPSQFLDAARGCGRFVFAPNRATRRPVQDGRWAAANAAPSWSSRTMGRGGSRRASRQRMVFRARDRARVALADSVLAVGWDAPRSDHCEPRPWRLPPHRSGDRHSVHLPQRVSVAKTSRSASHGWLGLRVLRLWTSRSPGCSAAPSQCRISADGRSGSRAPVPWPTGRSLSDAATYPGPLCASMSVRRRWCARGFG